MITSDTADKVLQLLVTVSGTDEVRTNPDLPLYDYQVLDSMKTVELMIALEEEFGIKVSPAEFEREMWKTPRKIIADVEQRLEK
jgi:D-alanine--poly(phosphoribitol) ligase subunit 2